MSTLFLVVGAVMLWLMHAKLKYSWKTSAIVAAVVGIFAPTILLFVLNNVRLVLMICVIAIVAFYLYNRSSENTEIRQWKSQPAPQLSTTDFSTAVTEGTNHVDDTIPYNRAQYFSSGIENIDTINDYPLIFQAQPSDDEMLFREFGYLVTTRGVIVKIQEKNSKTDAEEKYTVNTLLMPFQGVYRYVVDEQELTVYYDSHSNKTIKLAENQISELGKIFDIAINSGWTKISNNKVNDKVPAEVVKADLDKAASEAEKMANRANLNATKSGILSSLNDSVKYDLGENQINDRFGGGQGHGHVGEQYGDTLDRLKLKNAQRLGATHEKNGADRNVNGVNIQTKYLKTAKKSVGQVFDGHTAKYISSDGSMMQVEVPRDQYHQGVQEMAKRIKNGDVPNENNPANAIRYVKKGAISYEHAQIATKSIFDRHSKLPMYDENNKVIRDENGNVQMRTVTLGEKLVWSAGGDFLTGAASAIPTAIVSGIWIYCSSCWDGVDQKTAMKNTVLAVAKPIVWGGLMYKLPSQIAGSDVGQNVGKKIFGDMAKKELTPRITGLTMGVITTVVMVGPDVINCIRGRISAKQLLKNTVVNGTGMAVGIAASRAITSAIPVVGTAVAMAGTVIGSIGARKIMDHFVEDDAVAMIRIAKEEFIETVLTANLKKVELDSILNQTFLNDKFNKQLQTMFAADDSRDYIHQVYFDDVVNIYKERELPDEAELAALV